MINVKNNIPAIILSGGSEIVSLSLAEALVPYQVPLVVFSLGRSSLIRDIQKGMVYRTIDWPPNSFESALAHLTSLLEEIGAGRPCPWPVFATEDGGLRLLMEGRNRLSKYLSITGSPLLDMGGLDKAETFEFLAKNNRGDLIAPSFILKEFSQVPEAINQLGQEIIFKPGLKPFSMQLETMDSKVVTPKPAENDSSLISRLSKAWPISKKWIAQIKLKTPEKGEAVWWGLRSKNGKIFGLTAYERWKQPRIGGTACWVELEEIPELHEFAKKILTSLDFRGLVELPFLKDVQDQWRLLEINPRPWLQVALAARAGIPLVYAAYLDMLDSSLPDLPTRTDPKSWTNVERMILAALSGEYGPKFKTLYKALSIIYKSDCKIVYDTSISKVRIRWLVRMTHNIFKKFTVALRSKILRFIDHC